MTPKQPLIRLLATALCLAGTAQAAEETRTTVYVYDASGQVVREVVEPFTKRLCVGDRVRLRRLRQPHHHAATQLQRHGHPRRGQ